MDVRFQEVQSTLVLRQGLGFLQLLLAERLERAVDLRRAASDGLTGDSSLAGRFLGGKQPTTMHGELTSRCYARCLTLLPLSRVHMKSLAALTSLALGLFSVAELAVDNR